ncbi:hypothetical protein VTK26DRAFT_8204 [Humicola hyalothermophila]
MQSKITRAGVWRRGKLSGPQAPKEKPRASPDPAFSPNSSRPSSFDPDRAMVRDEVFRDPWERAKPEPRRYRFHSDRRPQSTLDYPEIAEMLSQAFGKPWPGSDGGAS